MSVLKFSCTHIFILKSIKYKEVTPVQDVEV